MTILKRIFGKKEKPQSRMPRSPRGYYGGPDVDELVEAVTNTVILTNEFNRIAHDQEVRAQEVRAHDTHSEPSRHDPTPSYDYGSSSHDSGSYDSGSSDSGSCGGGD